MKSKSVHPWTLGIWVFLAFGIAGYAVFSYLTGHPLEAGFLKGKSHYQQFVPNATWTLALVWHVAGGSLALIAGGAQWLCTRWRPRNFHKIHIALGIAYVLGILVGASAGLFLVPHAMGGAIAAWGFGMLNGLWIVSTLIAAVLGFRIAKHPTLRTAHRRWMMRSFALTAAAITLRLWLPLGLLAQLDFITAYVIVSWLCWVPNLVVAEVLARRTEGA